MKFKILGFVFLLGFSCLQSLAQLMDGQPAVFSQKDSLRGTLSSFRSCYDVTYYHLAVKINVEAKTIQGSNSISFKCLSDFEELQIDLFENLNIDQILFQGKALTFKRVYNAVFIKFPNTILKGQVRQP